MITLTTPLTKGKYTGKSINEIEDHFYICWIYNNWEDEFGEDVKIKFSYSAYVAKNNNYGSNQNSGITMDSCWNNLS